MKPSHSKHSDDAFDYVIVGAGAAGSVLANATQRSRGSLGGLELIVVHVLLAVPVAHARPSPQELAHHDAGKPFPAISSS